MIAEHEVECTTASHGNALCTCIIILGDDTIGHFVVSTNEVCCGCAEISCHHGFGTLTIAVVRKVCVGENKGGRRCGCGRVGRCDGGVRVMVGVSVGVGVGGFESIGVD